MSFQVYDHYVSSEISWVGYIPSHWKIRRLKTLFTRQQRPPDEREGIITAFRDGQVTLRTNRRVEGFTNAIQEIGYQGVRKGDLVIHAMDAFAGAVGVSDSDGKSTPVYSVCKPNSEADVNYYGRLLRHMAVSGFIASLSKGIRERSTEFRWSDASVLALPYPPLEEQVAIAAFLDREIAKIDALVEEQKCLIELLKEKRQAVISHAVTKGLDPDVSMKDSGLEWLGEVPAHWKVISIRRLSSHVVDCLHTTPTYDGELEYPAIRTADVERGKLLLNNARLVSEEVYEERIQRLAPRAGDILYSREGERFGMAALVPDNIKLCLGQRMMMFRINEIAEPAFVMWALNSEPIFQQVCMRTVGSTSPHINISEITNFRLPLPPATEQRRIADAIAAATDEIDALVEESGAAISLFEERRSALISAAVTGKIDVRHPAQQQIAAE